MDTSAKKAGKTVILMVLFTLFAKALGLVRQILIAGLFGATTAGIAFSAASKIPFAIFDMLFSTAIVGSFLPIYRSGLLKGKTHAKQFSSAFLTAITLITAMTAMLGVLLARPVIALSAPNLDAETAALAAELLRIMFPAVVFAGAAYTLIGILQSHERFLIPAAVSAVSNLVIILYLFFAKSPDDGAARGLAAAYLLSWTVQFLTLAFPLMKDKLFPPPTRHLKNEELRLSLSRSLPVMLGSWLIPLGTLTANFFSTYIDMGGENGTAIVVFENAFSVYTIAAGLLTYGVCNYIFPKLSASFAAGDRKGFAQAIQKSTLASFAITLPIGAAAFILAENGISLLYERGNFTAALSHATAMSLRMLALAMPAYGLIELFSRVCYSAGKVRYPMFAALGGISAGMLSSSLFLLTKSLTVSTVALSCAIGEITAATVLCALAVHAFPEILHGLSLRRTIGIATAFAISTLTMYISRMICEKFWQNAIPVQNLVIITIVFLMGLVVYLLCIGIFNAADFSARE